jgi:hypothetical protein
MHEVRWLPSFQDQEFTSTIAPNVNGVGTMLATLSGVDGTFYVTNSWTANGYFEVTTVWEWTPAYANSTAIPISAPPSRSSLQQILSSVGDLGRFVYGRMPAVGERLLTAGITAGARRGAGLLIQN